MPEKQRCGAKTRAGRPCRNWAMPNGRCRLHGGKSEGGGAPAGNKNAVTTGEYESIYADALSAEERSFFLKVDTEIEAQLEEQIRLSSIRMRRMMLRIKRLKGEEFTLVELKKKSGTGPKGPVDIDEEKREAVLGQIQRIEEALNRVVKRHTQLLKLKHRIEESKPPTDDADVSGYLEAINNAAEALEWQEEE